MTAKSWTTKELLAIIAVIAPLLGVGGNQAISAISPSKQINIDIDNLRAKIDTGFAEIKTELKEQKEEFRSERGMNRTDHEEIMGIVIRQDKKITSLLLSEARENGNYNLARGAK